MFILLAFSSNFTRVQNASEALIQGEISMSPQSPIKNFKKNLLSYPLGEDVSY
jgi:hypothetical protein